MGRPRGSTKTKDVAVKGKLELGPHVFPWEQQLLAHPFREILDAETANHEPLNDPEATNDHA